MIQAPARIARAWVVKIVREESVRLELNDPGSQLSRFARTLREYRERALNDPAPGFNLRLFEAHFLPSKTTTRKGVTVKNPIRAWAVTIVRQAIQEDRDEQDRQKAELREAMSKPWAPEYADWYNETQQLVAAVHRPRERHARIQAMLNNFGGKR